MKTICFFDIANTGHHNTYARKFISQGLAECDQVVLIYPETQAIRDWLTEEGIDEQVIYVSLPEEILNRGLKGPFKNHYRLLLFLRRANRFLKQVEAEHDLEIDLVYFLWFYDFVEMVPFYVKHLIPFMFRYNWGALIFKLQKYTYTSEVKRAGLIKLPPETIFEASNCKFITVFDKHFQDFLQKRYQDNTKVYFLPESTYEQVQDYYFADEVKKKGEGKFKILLIGSIAKRKGILKLLKANEYLDHDQFSVILAGAFKNDYKSDQEFNSVVKALVTQENLIVHPDWIESPAAFNKVVKEVDLIYAVYNDFPYTANMLPKATVNKVPIVVAAGAWMGNEVERLDVGWTFPENEPPKKLAQLFKQIEQDEKEYIRKKKNLQKHEYEYSEASVFKLLREQLRNIFNEIK